MRVNDEYAIVFATTVQASYTSSIKENKIFYFLTYEIENVARVLTLFLKYILYISFYKI